MAALRAETVCLLAARQYSNIIESIPFSSRNWTRWDGGGMGWNRCHLQGGPMIDLVPWYHGMVCASFTGPGLRFVSWNYGYVCVCTLMGCGRYRAMRRLRKIARLPYPPLTGCGWYTHTRGGIYIYCRGSLRCFCFFLYLGCVT